MSSLVQSADTITVNASANLANNVGAHFNVIVDGVKVGSGVAGTKARAFTFKTGLASGVAHDVQVVYDNDAVINGEDRNLLLQSIVVDGKTLAANGPQEVYRTAYGNTIAGSGHMAWNGTADFMIPAGFLPPPAPAAFYVAVTGSDTAGDGSQAKPFASLARAQSAMEAGSIRTTYVEGGTYELSQSLMLTSADNGMSFISAPGQHAVLDGSGAGLVNLITMNGTSNVTLQGLTFENTTPGYFNGAVTLMNATANRIIGNLFNNNDRAVLVTGSSGNTISGNEMDNNVTAGVNAGAGSNNNVIDSNLINGTALFGTGTGSAGIWLTGGNYNTITHNSVNNTAGGAISMANWNTDPSNLNIGNTVAYNSIVNANSSPGANDSGAIYIDGRAGADTKTVINNNYVNLAPSPANNLSVGIYLDDWTSGAKVTNNIVTNANIGFHIHGGSNNSFSNNIFDMGTRAAYNLGAGVLQSNPGGPIATMTGDVVSQNIVYSTAAASPNVYVVYGGSATITGNLYFNNQGQPMSASVAGMDGQAQWGDPKFASAGSGNYSLGAGSAATSIGFKAIDQSTIGLAPTTTHWY